MKLRKSLRLYKWGGGVRLIGGFVLDYYCLIAVGSYLHSQQLLEL